MEGSHDRDDKIAEPVCVKEKNGRSSTIPVPLAPLHHTTDTSNGSLPVDDMLALMYYQSAMMTSLSQQSITNMMMTEKVKPLQLQKINKDARVNMSEIGLFGGLDTSSVKPFMPPMTNSDLCPDGQHGNCQVTKLDCI